MRRAAAVAAVAAIVLAGCTAEPMPSPSPTPSPDYVSTYEPPAPTQLAPLTGVTVAAGSLEHPAISAKIDNHAGARPQVGLERTDIVFEELVEGGITRYVAVWHSDVPELIGPIRSIRPMDPDIISPFGGIAFYAGGQQRFVSLMRNTPVYNAIHGMGDTADYMYRTKDKRAPHNVIVKAEAFAAAHGDIAPPRQQFAYSLDAASSTAAKEGSPTASVALSFSYLFKPSWNYDAARSVYLRSQAGVVDVDSNGTQLSAVNVVTLRVKVVDDTNVPKTLFQGSGEAWVTTGGGTVHGTWHKASKTDAVRLIGDDGIEIRLGAGNTWVELVPTAGSVTMVAPAA